MSGVSAGDSDEWLRGEPASHAAITFQVEETRSTLSQAGVMNESVVGSRMFAGVQVVQGRRAQAFAQALDSRLPGLGRDSWRNILSSSRQPIPVPGSCSHLQPNHDHNLHRLHPNFMPALQPFVPLCHPHHPHLLPHTTPHVFHPYEPDKSGNHFTVRPISFHSNERHECKTLIYLIKQSLSP